MADKLPLVKCPLKLGALMANSFFVQSMIEDPDFMLRVTRDRPALVKCEKDKCGAYTAYHVTEEVEDDSEAGSHEEARTVEGCAIALVPERLERLGDLQDAAEELSEGVRGVSLLLAGAAKIAATKFGLEDDLAKLAEEAGDEEDEDEGAEEPAEEEAEAR